MDDRVEKSGCRAHHPLSVYLRQPGRISTTWRGQLVTGLGGCDRCLGGLPPVRTEIQFARQTAPVGDSGSGAGAGEFFLEWERGPIIY
jgi:hypothetical protein